MKQIWTALLAGLLLAGAICQLTVTGQERAQLQQSILRLHIVAASDTSADQSVKLAVRDALLAEYGAQLSAAGSREEAALLAQSLLPAMLETARTAAAKQGSFVPISGEVVECPFPAVSYDGLTLPAGTYQAVRLTLGEGAGHNWFCVLYPAVCLGSATLADSVTSAQRDMLENPEHYEIRFAILDGLAQVWRFLTGE